jgi:hypothetical protein
MKKPIIVIKHLKLHFKKFKDLDVLLKKEHHNDLCNTRIQRPKISARQVIWNACQRHLQDVNCIGVHNESMTDKICYILSYKQIMKKRKQFTRPNPINFFQRKQFCIISCNCILTLQDVVVIHPKISVNFK